MLVRLTLTLAALGSAIAAQPFVMIQTGTILGVDLPQYNQALFLGIPYAKPPVGDLRLRPPRSINASFGTLDATAYGPHCWSRFTTGFDDNSGFENSENCLTLNVIQPHGASEDSPVPVLVWIHGGGLTTGGSADKRYNGSWIVEASIANRKPIVLVSLNYRLASLGFLAGKALADERSLNLGVRDQRLALHWVQENISNSAETRSSKVTIMGESSGATSVHTQIIAYAGRDDHLFNQAIAQSGINGSNFSLPTATSFQATFDSLLANTSCASRWGVRGIVFDGGFLDAAETFEAYRTGKCVRVAFLVGSNTDEGRSFAAQGANTTAEASASLTSVPTGLRARILELYPDVPALGCPFNTGDSQLDPMPNGAFATPGRQNKRVAAIVGDVGMAAGPRWLAREVSSRVPFYKYRYVHFYFLPPRHRTNSYIFNHIPWSVSFANEDYIGHFTEVSYVFNLQNDEYAFSLSVLMCNELCSREFWVNNHFTATYLGPGAPIADRFLGTYMARAWASFVATGDPNNANGN
ncbi:Carboxylic ester hydrolase [Mycena kentingensis (nom. inval.)]|nr:Carboxylic ester hydrolase [Mycena kentingensis (nom. inval.)]